jgi:spore coat polysaccharide biosynthesis protein SpsF
MPRVVGIIQARMGSSRLPGKVLLDIAGKPMIQHVIERTQRARTLDAVITATTTDEADRPVADFCAASGLLFYRGSPHDVLDRYYQVAKLHQADVVVRITGDCPLIDPILIDATSQLVTANGPREGEHFDFGCNRLPPPFTRSFPIGLDVEACTFAALEGAWTEASEPFHREHVMPYLYEGVALSPSSAWRMNDNVSLSIGLSPHGFHIAQLHHHPDYGSLRWTVDTPEDLTFVREVLARLRDKPEFTWQDVLRVVEDNPGLASINADIRHKTVGEVDARFSPGLSRPEGPRK